MTLNGVANFINLSTATGPNSCGLVLPLLGTATSSSTAPGWSFEFVWKPLGEQNTWAKLADFGNGASSGYYPSSNDDWTLGFDGNDQTEFLLETYNAGPGSGMPYTTPNYTHGWAELQTLVIGQWSASIHPSIHPSDTHRTAPHRTAPPPHTTAHHTTPH